MKRNNFRGSTHNNVGVRCLRRSLNFVSVLVIGSASFACTWVKPIDGAADIVVVEFPAPPACTRLGTTTVSTRSRVGLINRHSKKVQEELIQLAKNEAAKVDANTIAPVAQATPEGSRDYYLLDCP